MAILVLAQAGGAGTQADNASLETAWQGLPVTATLSDEGAGSTYLHELLGDSPSDGLSVSVANESSRIATYTHTGGSGSYRIRATVTDPAGVQTVFVRVVRVTRDAAGATLDAGMIKPAFGERPGESTVDARGSAGVYDRNVAAQAARSFAGSTSLPDSDATLALTARRQVIESGTLTAARTYEIPDGAADGETISIDREDASHHRVYVVNADGTTAGYCDHVGRHRFEWKSGAGWSPLALKSADRSFRLEHFATGVGPVGVGDAEADTSAFEAFLAAFKDYDTPTNQDLTFELVIPARFLLNRTVYVKRTDYSTCRIRGIAAGNGGGMGPGFTWAGDTAWSVSGVNMAFDRTARTIVRSSGSWVTTGAAAGQSVLVTNPTAVSILNVRLFDSIASVGGTGNDTLTITAPEATYPTVGFDTAGMMPYTEAATAGYIVTQHVPMLVLEGASGVELRDLTFDCDDKASCGIHVDIRPDRTQAMNIRDARILGCAVYSPINAWNSDGIMVGRPPSSPNVGSDINNVEISHPIVQATSSGHQGCGIRFWDGNNTKIHHIDRPQIWYFRRGIDHESASETISITRPHIESCETQFYNNGYMTISDGESERCGIAVDGVRGRCVEINNSWNLSGSFVVARQQSHELHRCTYINDNVKMLIGSINTGTGIVTAALSGSRVPQNGDEVVVRPATGWLGMPGILQSTWHDRASQIFYLGDVTSAGGGNYTFSLRVSRSGSAPSYTLGAAVTFTSSGSGNIWILSPCMFVTGTGLVKPSGEGQGVSFDSCHIQGALDVPHVGAADGTSVFDSYGTYSGSTSGRVSVRHSNGFTPGPVLQSLSEIASVPMFGNAQHVPLILYYAEQAEWVVRGVDGWSVLRVRAASLASGTFRAGSFAIFYVDLPFRCGVELVTSEVVTAFAAPGLTVATVKVGHVDVGQGDGDDDDAYLLSTSLMTFANLSDRRKGYAGAERGVRLATPPYFPKYAGATDWGWSNRMAMIVRIDLTGATLSALTAGDLLLGFKLAHVPDWKRT